MRGWSCLMEYLLALNCEVSLKKKFVFSEIFGNNFLKIFSPSEFVNGELGMFTGADCGWSILDDIPADIELSISYCAVNEELFSISDNCWRFNSLKPYKQRRFLRSFSIGLNSESFSIAKIYNKNFLVRNLSPSSSSWKLLPASKLPVKTLETGLIISWNCSNCYWLWIVSYLLCCHSALNSLYC